MRSARLAWLLVAGFFIAGAADGLQARAAREPATTPLARDHGAAASSAAASAPTPTPVRPCAPDMVRVPADPTREPPGAAAFCIDRWEMSLVEPKSGRRVSPYYHPSRALALRDQREWEHQRGRVGPWSARQIALPELPAWQADAEFNIRAESKPGVTPNAYLDLESARRACSTAGKRLCGHAEWVRACQSERRTRHPYGERYRAGTCKLNAPQHPAPLLHGAAGLGHRDPRLNLVEHRGRPLLEPTGSHPQCKSDWGEDAVFDMVGGLDEWIDDDSGVFVGGFFARDTVHGCQARVTVHTPDYYDYSLGARCCK